MGAKYSSVSISGYNATPPSDDGSATEANKVKWSTVKTKIGDPTKTAVESINTALVTALNTSARSITASDTAVAGDHLKTIEIASSVTSAVTVTLSDAATMAAGYIVTVSNQSAVVCTIARATSGDTINGTAANISIPATSSITFLVNSATNGYITAGQSDNAAFAGSPVGAVSPYAGTSAPTGWLLCYGQAVSRTTYAALFAVVSTTYGVGDGSTTFNVPDLRGRVVAGQDDMGGSSADRLTNQTNGIDGDTLGATGGAETHTLTTAQIPSHTHDISVATNTAVITQTAGATPGNTGTTSTAAAGGGGAHNNVQPTLILNYIIKT